MPNIYVTRQIPEAGLELLRKKFGTFEINTEDRVLTKKELKEKVKGRDGILSLLTDPIDAEILEEVGSQCKVISNYAVGFNNIDVATASKKKIMVTNTPGVLTDATADLAIALLFSCARSIVEADKFTREGKFRGWAPMLFLGQDITGRTLGIVGAGRIGSNVAIKMAKGFGMKILYVNRTRETELEAKTGAKQVDMKTLLKESDFVSLHVNLSPETTHMIGEKELNLMKPNSILINTARGPVVDEKALVKALKEKKIFGAGLDVFEREPEIEKELLTEPRAIIVPHIASATLWTRSRMAEMAAQNLIDALEGKMPEYCVNKDQI